MNFGRFAILAQPAYKNSPSKVEQTNTENQTETQNEPHQEQPVDESHETAVKPTQHDGDVKAARGAQSRTVRGAQRGQSNSLGVHSSCNCVTTLSGFALEKNLVYKRT